jgi:hypothetical protein
MRLATLQLLTNALFAWLISHQPAVLLSQNNPATSNQPTILFSQKKSALAISHQPNEQAESGDTAVVHSASWIWHQLSR